MTSLLELTRSHPRVHRLAWPGGGRENGNDIRRIPILALVSPNSDMISLIPGTAILLSPVETRAARETTMLIRHFYE